ncbi:Xbx-6 [Aphelenchoides fujianensis]|nr:Xbx-6 [Aphelenchoides fujianensis]
MFTKKDLTSYIGVIAVISIFLFMFGLVAMVIATMAFHARLLYTIYAGMAALLLLGLARNRHSDDDGRTEIRDQPRRSCLRRPQDFLGYPADSFGCYW